jgi:hypothetical protein
VYLPTYDDEFGAHTYLTGADGAIEIYQSNTGFVRYGGCVITTNNYCMQIFRILEMCLIDFPGCFEAI